MDLDVTSEPVLHLLLLLHGSNERGGNEILVDK